MVADNNIFLFFLTAVYAYKLYALFNVNFKEYYLNLTLLFQLTDQFFYHFTLDNQTICPTNTNVPNQCSIEPILHC